MTLQNGLLTPDAAYLWSETGLYTWERQLVGHNSKFFVSGSWPWAIIHSGTEDVSAELEFAICSEQPSSLAALVSCVQTALKPHLNHEWPGGQRVLIGAYEGGPHLILVTTQEQSGYPPLTPLPIRTHMISGGSEGISQEVAKGVTLESMGRIIRQQHADSAMEANWPLAGKVTRARVSSDGVEFVEVDELPDPTASTVERVVGEAAL